MPSIKSAPSAYAKVQRVKAAAWKARTATLPTDARRPAPYVDKVGRGRGPLHDFCLPPEYAELVLLPEVRKTALDLFAELEIPWHAGVGTGPSNHLLSSQVQCVNALMPMVSDPGRVRAAFGAVLDIAKVLPIEPGRHLTFEYIGPTDFFGESRSGQRVRGSRCTSVDAAIRYRTSDGSIELALVEWKYTESYGPRRADATKDRERADRYASYVVDPYGPVRSDLLDLDLMFDEPLYQLVRQQLLAHELERTGAEGASRVRVVHVLPPANAAYQDSLDSPVHRALGTSVSDVWRRLLRRPDRFVSLDPATFLDRDLTSREYCLRYADDVLYDETDLVSAFELTEPRDLEDVVYAEEFEGEVELRPDGVELIYDGVGIELTYPFRASELIDLAGELAAT